jgi:hypothetical protein
LSKKLKSSQTLPEFLPDLKINDIGKEVVFDVEFGGISKMIINPNYKLTPLFQGMKSSWDLTLLSLSLREGRCLLQIQTYGSSTSSFE